MRHLLSVDDLSVRELRALTTAQTEGVTVAQAPRGTLAFLFQQPSLRTLSSFARAGVRGGLVPVGVTINGDPFRDRFDFEDEIVQLGLTSTCVVVRRASPLDRAAVSVCSVPLVNAGDGTNEHPTQSLVDIAAMRRHGLEGKRVVLMGNLRDHRVHHSLAKALAKLGVAFTMLCPPGLAMGEGHRPTGMECVETSAADYVNEILLGADFVYLTPTAYWTAPDLDDTGAFSMDLSRARRVLKPGARILHPFPRLRELARDLDRSPYDAYHLQTSLAPDVRFRVLRWLVDDVVPADTGPL